jgi:hypothetical protein
MIVLRPLADNPQSTAACSETDAVGDLVHVSGPVQDGQISVTKVDITEYAKMPSIGVIVSKLSPTRCVVQMEGEIKGVYSNLSPGRIYFVGLSGQPVAAPPTPAPGGKAYLQPVGVALGEDVLALKLHLNLTVLRG